MNVAYVAPQLRRTLSAVYQFYDAFFFPIDDRNLPVTSPLEVSIPRLEWNAFYAEDDLTYRFSTPTLTQPAPGGANLAVRIMALRGDYVSLEPILLTLPLPLSVPPKRADFLITKPLWPTTSVRPPQGETAIRGQIRSSTAQPVNGLKVQMWSGAEATPPAATPFTHTNATGDFLFRFPYFRAAAGTAVSIRAQVNGGAIPILTSSFSIEFGRTQFLQLQRT